MHCLTIPSLEIVSNPIRLATPTANTNLTKPQNCQKGWRSGDDRKQLEKWLEIVYVLEKNGNVETGLGHRTQAAGQSITYITCKFYVVLFVKKGPARFKIVAHGQRKIFHNDLQDTLTYALPSVFHDRHACAQERNTFHDFCSWFGKN